MLNVFINYSKHCKVYIKNVKLYPSVNKDSYIVHDNSGRIFSYINKNEISSIVKYQSHNVILVNK